MHRIGMTAAVVALVAMAPSVRAQGTSECPLPQDVKAIPAALDAVITGSADKDATCLRALFLPEARLVPVRLDSSGKRVARIYSVDEYVANKAKRGAEELEEKQVKFSSTQFGDVAHLWSTYVLKVAGKQYARGLNSIQAVKTDAGWRVLEVAWQAETPQLQVPKELLPE